MKIIGGIVSYEDGVKTVEGDQFSPTRKVKVELNFALEEGGDDQDAAVNAVLDKAQLFVTRKLGLSAPTAAATRRKPDSGTPAVTPARTKEDLAREAGVAEGSKPGPKRTGASQAPTADPAAVVEPDPAAVAATVAPTAQEDEFSVPATLVVTPVSDDALNSEVQRVNQKLKDPVKIRGLVAEFKPADWTQQFTLRDIPQAQRQEFLTKLKNLA